MFRSLSLCLVAFIFPTQALCQDGFIGIYADSTAQNPCTTVLQGTFKTLYVIAKLEGASANGISGAEFRIEVDNPNGWLINYTSPDSASVDIGDPVDREPQNPSNPAGINLAFPSCQTGADSLVIVGTLSVYNAGGTTTNLLVKRHTTPSNINYACPLFTLCDEPAYTSQCMSANPSGSCINPSKVSQSTAGDESVFAMVLGSASSEPSESLQATGGSSANLTHGSSQVDIVSAVPGYPGGPTKSSRLNQPASVHWFETWDFETGDLDGWQALDHRVFAYDDPDIPWLVDAMFDGVSTGDVTISGSAASLTERNNSCWAVQTGGYGNSWDYAIQIEYQGSVQLQFDLLIDSQNPQDLFFVEADPLGASQTAPYNDPWETPRTRRSRLHTVGGTNHSQVVQVDLPDFDDPLATHHVLLRFVSDSDTSPEDTSVGWTLGAAVVVDNIRLLLGGVEVLNEDFESTVDSRISFVQSGDALPFGSWGRNFTQVTDNDICVDNDGSSVIFSDHLSPTVANDPSLAFGPGSYVIRNWLDNVLVSPWFNVLDLEDGLSFLKFDRFPGQSFPNSGISQAISVRGKIGNCIGEWPSEANAVTSEIFFEFLGGFSWETNLFELSHLWDDRWTEAQVRFRFVDLQFLVPGLFAPPSPFLPGPGPYLDNVQIGRQAFSGPIFVEGIGDSRWQAQDAFATEAIGTYWRPSNNRFGSAAFSMAADIAAADTAVAALIPGDSIIVGVLTSGPFELREVSWFGAISSGPHAGKAPPPFTAGPNGFFEVAPGNVLDELGNVVDGGFFVDLDDEYFRGGDVLKYFWVAEDENFVANSLPSGISTLDWTGTVEDAENATGGLFEVSYLPTIDWDPGYLARIAADPHGKLDPNPIELSNSRQDRCILYVNQVNRARRSGDVNRTSFMYTLDALGYEDQYDVYDQTGTGNTFSDLAGRADMVQATGYALIVHDAGREEIFPVPTGGEGQKIDQATWYQNWLNNGVTSEAGIASLWFIGEDIAQSLDGHSLLSVEMGVTLNSRDQGINVNPNADGVSSMTFSNGNIADFSNDLFSLAGGCPSVRDYDDLGFSGEGIITHHWRDPGTGTLGNGAIVMKASSANSYNTILMAMNWFDIVPFFPHGPGTPAFDLAQQVLDAILPTDCVQTPTDAYDGEDRFSAPEKTALRQNFPNPFNPTTVISFDLAKKGHVELTIFDAAGKRIRRLLNGVVGAGRHEYVWNGRDDTGRRVASGVYFYKLRETTYEDTKRLVLVR